MYENRESGLGRANKLPDSPKSQWQTWLIGGMGILVLAVALTIFLKGGREISSIKVRLDQLERTSSQLETVEDKVARLNRVIISSRADFEDSIERLNKWRLLLDQRLAEQIQRYYELGRRDALAPTEGKELPNGDKRGVPQTKDRYHEVRSGETLYRISKKYEMSLKELCRLNEITPENVIRPGEKLLVTSEK